MNTKNSVSNKVIVIYLVIFYIWWTIEELAYWSYTSNSLAQVLLSSSVKLLTWSIPAFILIKKYSHQLKIGYPQLFKNRFKLWPYLVGIFIMVTYLAIILYFEKQFKNLTELEDAIRDYIEYYNQKRIKIKLKGLTPLEYRQLVLS